MDQLVIETKSVLKTLIKSSIISSLIFAYQALEYKSMYLKTVLTRYWYNNLVFFEGDFFSKRLFLRILPRNTWVFTD